MRPSKLSLNFRWLSLRALPTISETIAVVFGLLIIAHGSQECYVDRSHSELESIEMQIKVMTKNTENLHNTKERNEPQITLVTRLLGIEMSITVWCCGDRITLSISKLIIWG